MPTGNSLVSVAFKQFLATQPLRIFRIKNLVPCRFFAIRNVGADCVFGKPAF